MMDVVARAAPHRVGSGAAVEGIVARAAVEGIVAGGAVELVCLTVSRQRVAEGRANDAFNSTELIAPGCARTALASLQIYDDGGVRGSIGCRVGTGSPDQLVRSGTAIETVVARAAIEISSPWRHRPERIGAIATEQRVTSIQPIERVISTASVECVVGGGSQTGIVTVGAGKQAIVFEDRARGTQGRHSAGEHRTATGIVELQDPRLVGLVHRVLVEADEIVFEVSPARKRTRCPPVVIDPG